MAVAESALIETMLTCWEMVLCQELTLTDKHRPDACSDTILGTVHVSGEWSGVVSIECPVELANSAASVMFEMDVGDLDPDDVQDAYGEVINIVGGNIKNLVPQPTTLSCPTVVTGTNWRMRLPGTEIQSKLYFEAEGMCVVLTVFKRTEGAAAQGAQ